VRIAHYGSDLCNPSKEAGVRVWLKRTVLIVAVVFVVIQVVRPSRTNPPIDPALEINSIHTVTPAVSAIFARACDDCHSNRTVWPWYSAVAPSSWLVAHDVNDGRSKMNLSEWASYPQDKRFHLLKGICEKVTRGKMPIATYTLIHTSARLTPGDVQTLCQWTKTPERTVPSRVK
jgi:Haem-binding domain